MTDTPDRVMVDIETLGTDPGAAILSIGAVRFGTHGLGDDFYRPISLRSCESAGLTIDADTLLWWLEQNDAAKAAIPGGDPLADVLVDFADWCRGADEVWANSPAFDCAILSYAYDAADFGDVDISPPWSYADERDVRTIATLPSAPDLEHDGVEHNAVDDARHQARVVAATLNDL